MLFQAYNRFRIVHVEIVVIVGEEVRSEKARGCEARGMLDIECCVS